jgi:RNA polymerase subunit RPABC4/transcription elongation factor Spt4
MHCQNCGQVNTQASNFCRFCGTKITPAMQYSNGNNYNPMPNPAPVNYENAPPRPYSWKTDEYQIPETPKAKPINRVQPLPNFPPPMPQRNMGMQPFQQAQAMSHNFHCPRCSSQLYPRITRQISTAGWIVFAVLLLTIFPLFWIGFLIKEEVRICPVCSFRYR